MLGVLMMCRAQVELNAVQSPLLEFRLAERAQHLFF